MVITNPSSEGTLAVSFSSCVRMDMVLFPLKGLTRCVPSGKTSPVTRPNSVSTPTFPAGT